MEANTAWGISKKPLGKALGNSQESIATKVMRESINYIRCMYALINGTLPLLSNVPFTSTAIALPCLYFPLSGTTITCCSRAVSQTKTLLAEQREAGRAKRGLQGFQSRSSDDRQHKSHESGETLGFLRWFSPETPGLRAHEEAATAMKLQPQQFRLLPKRFLPKRFRAGK